MASGRSARLPELPCILCRRILRPSSTATPAARSLSWCDWIFFSPTMPPSSETYSVGGLTGTNYGKRCGRPGCPPPPTWQPSWGCGPSPERKPGGGEQPWPKGAFLLLPHPLRHRGRCSGRRKLFARIRSLEKEAIHGFAKGRPGISLRRLTAGRFKPSANVGL